MEDAKLSLLHDELSSKANARGMRGGLGKGEELRIKGGTKVASAKSDKMPFIKFVPATGSRSNFNSKAVNLEEDEDVDNAAPAKPSKSQPLAANDDKPGRDVPAQPQVSVAADPAAKRSRQAPEDKPNAPGNGSAADVCALSLLRIELRGREKLLRRLSAATAAMATCLILGACGTLDRSVVGGVKISSGRVLSLTGLARAGEVEVFASVLLGDGSTVSGVVTKCRAQELHVVLSGDVGG
jgi:hypothetical protein